MHTDKVIETLTDFRQRHGGISRTKTYEEIKSGRLRVIKVGRRTYVAREDAEAWLRTYRDISTPADSAQVAT